MSSESITSKNDYSEAAASLKQTLVAPMADDFKNQVFQQLGDLISSSKNLIHVDWVDKFRSAGAIKTPFEIYNFFWKEVEEIQTQSQKSHILQGLLDIEPTDTTLLAMVSNYQKAKDSISEAFKLCWVAVIAKDGAVSVDFATALKDSLSASLLSFSPSSEQSFEVVAADVDNEQAQEAELGTQDDSEVVSRIDLSGKYFIRFLKEDITIQKTHKAKLKRMFSKFHPNHVTSDERGICLAWDDFDDDQHVGCANSRAAFNHFRIKNTYVYPRSTKNVKFQMELVAPDNLLLKTS
ncbi:hypothetical protein B0O99DRAFT_598350 [Bisporella sp. PMI_857]|nr:hypothetical protein B0O99DRAFT_598350 [Bisporella sp. PMI_857]